MIPVGTELEVTVDRPVAGGSMIARHDGRVMLVSGAIAGERVRVTVDRASRQMLWAHTIDVLEPSPDRREPICDPACGGSSYAHIQYERQRALKSEVIADSFRRLARLTLDQLPPVLGSPERGYRLRARLHVRSGRPGFFREGTHTLCEAAATGQLLPDALEAVERTLRALESRSRDCEAVTVAENVTATDRVLHLEPRDGARLDDVRLPGGLEGITGITTSVRGRLATLMGMERVTDTSEQLFPWMTEGRPEAIWTRHPASFFQANRFLIGRLVQHVLDGSDGERALDLYSGVGLFAVALAASGRRVTAVEGDRVSGADLRLNATPWADRLEVVPASVEQFLSGPRRVGLDVAILDPPRSGLSADALTQLVAWRVPRLVYVSCDPPTLARDTARLTAGGYSLSAIHAFDLFPNTPHVEAVAVFGMRTRK